MEKLHALTSKDILVLAGSIPSSMPDDMYSKIMAELQDTGAMIVVDATRDLLVNVLQYHPFLVKPNNHELGEIFDVELKTREDVVPYARKLQEMGATNVLVSMAGEGAVFVAADGSVSAAPAPKGTLVKTESVPETPWLPDLLPDGWKNTVMNTHSTWAFLPEAPAHFPSC